MHRLALASGLAAASVLACTAEPAIVSDDGFNADTGPEEDDDGGDDDDDDDDGMTDGSAPDEPVCGNDIIDGEDVCDGTALGDTTCQSLGFEAGQIGCTANCGGYDLSDCGFFECGNGDQEGEEDCDGTVGKATCVSEGFDNGTLFCTMDCEYNFERCGICGDGDVADEEDCDTEEDFDETCQGLGFMTGDLECGDDCLWDTSNCSTCGNGVQEGDEDCDGDDVPGKTCDGEGFDSGSLACDAACDDYDTSGCGTCGNMVIDGTEACDTADLGGASCASLGLGGGTLACDASCGFDTSMCDIAAVPFGSDSGYVGLELPAGMTTCDEISATGTPTGQSDYSTVTVALGFSFPFYGTDFTDVNVDSNGAIRFGETGQVGTLNICLPDDDNTLFVFWDDLNPAAAGNIYTQTLGMAGDQRFVVQYDVPNYLGDTTDLMRIQVMLSEASGEIDVCYVDTINAGNTADGGAEATAGIQLSAASFIQYSCNTADLVDGLQLRYAPN